MQHQSRDAALAGEPAEVLDGLLEYGRVALLVTWLALDERDDRVLDPVGVGLGRIVSQW